MGGDGATEGSNEGFYYPVSHQYISVLQNGAGKCQTYPHRVSRSLALSRIQIVGFIDHEV